MVAESERQSVLAGLARRADPADAGAQNNLGVVLLARGQRVGATAAFARAIALDPHMTLARRNLDAAAGEGWRARRIGELRARLRADGGDAGARRELAMVLADAGRIDDARRELAVLCALAPNDAGPCVQRALCEQRAGDLDAAVEWLIRAIECDPSAAVPRAHLGEILYHRGDPAYALTVLDEALSLAPEHADALYVRSFVLGELGRPAEAEASRMRALALNPALGRAHANLAAPTSTGTPNAVSRTADPAPGAPAHLALGLAFRQKGYFDEAIREYRRALARGEDDATIARALGELYLLRGMPEDAQPHWDRLVASHPDDPAGWHGRAVSAHLAGRLDDALDAYGHGIAVAPALGATLARAQNDLGVLLAAGGALLDAADAFAAAVHADPTSRAAGLNHAQLLAVCGEGERSVAAYRAVLRQHPDDADAWAGLGVVLAAAGRPGEARAALARALDADPTRADVRYEIGFLAAADGDHAAARRETEHAMADASLVLRRPLALAIDLGAGAEHAPAALGIAPAIAEPAPVRGFDVAPGALDALLGDVLSPMSEMSEACETSDVWSSAAGPGNAYAVAEECLRAGLYERASAAASATLARGASRVVGLTLLADVFAAQGYYGEALERYHEARTIDPLTVDAWLGEIRMLRETGRRDACRLVAESLLVEHPSDARVLALGAVALVDGDALEAGRETLGHAMIVLDEEETVEGWSDVARAWRALGDRREELTAWGRAIALAPTRWPLQLAAARALVALGELRQADAYLRELLREQPAFTDARLELSALRASTGDHRGARRLLVDVLEADALHLDALASLGASLLAEERVDDARVAIARTLRFDREHAHALALDGELLARDGSLAAARARWRYVLHAEPVGDGADRARHALMRYAS